MVEKLLSGHSRKVLTGFCIYKVLLDFIYIKCQRIFSGILELGLDFSIDKYLFSWLLFLVLTFLFNFFILYKDRLIYSFSQQVYLLLFLVSVVPFFTMYGSGAISETCFFYYNVYMYVLLIAAVTINCCFAGEGAFELLGSIGIGEVTRWKKRLFFIMCAAIITTILIVFFYYIGGTFFVDGLQVYGQRATYSHISKNIPSALLYLLGVANVVEVLLFIYCLQKKEYIYTGLLLLLLYMHFSIAAEKSVLFSVAFAIAIYCVSKNITMFRVVIFNIITALVCMILAFGHCIYYVTDWEQSDLLDLLCWFDIGIPASLFRRVVFLPAYLQDIWVRYFADRAPNYWGINTEYSIGQGVENYISDVYFNSPLGFANTGLLGDCFANMGVYGVFVYPVIIAIVLHCFDYVLRGKNVIIFMGLSLLLVINITNSMLTTLMVSHGGFVMLLMLWCFPDDFNAKRYTDID